MEQTELEKLRQAFDKKFEKAREVGFGEKKRVLTYIDAAKIKERIIEVWDNKFTWTINRCDIREFPNNSSWIIVHGTLTSPDGHSKDGIGGKEVSASTKDGKYFQLDQDLKSADSDAFKRAASLFGVGLYLYLDEDVTPEPVGKTIQEKFGATRVEIKEDLITPPQINLVKVLVNQLGHGEERFTEERKRFGVSSLAELTKQQAKTLIDELKKEREPK